jgi:phosphotransferase system HPr (HPr) family protein
MTSTPLTADITITHPLGLHLRVGKEMVHVTNQFRAAITAENTSRTSPVVDAKSILQLMQLQARQGHVLRVHADGPDAAEALRALRNLFEPAVDPGTLQTGL